MEFDDTQTTRVLEALGLPADTSDPEVVTLAVEDLASTPPDAATANAKAGLMGIEVTVYETLKAEAERGRAVAAAAASRERESAVNAAVSRGSIPPARKAHWLTVLEADPAMASVLENMPAVIPLQEIGHSGESQRIEELKWEF